MSSADRLGIFHVKARRDHSTAEDTMQTHTSHTPQTQTHSNQKYREQLATFDPEIEKALSGEERRQQNGVELIASENYTYPEVLACLGSVFTNKYSEGYPGRRYYGGQDFTDVIETVARDRACQLFRADHANVQPLSGSPMNQAVYFGYLKPGDTILGMDLSHGGHLTHGAPVSHMGKTFNFVRYKTHPEQGGAIDFDEVMALAKEVRPKIVLCGYSSYPRDLDYAAFKAVADEVGALTMADIAHIGGLVAADVMNNPLDAGFDFVTTTTHKSLRGPRGGLILCRKDHAKTIDKSVFPGLQGGPHMNVVAASAVTFKKSLEPAFKTYGQQVLANARVLAQVFLDDGATLITGGTDNHMMVVDTIKSFDLNGTEAEVALDHIGISVSRQITPDDPRPPLKPSGIRIGTPACTTRGMATDHMTTIGAFIINALRNADDDAYLDRLADEVHGFCRQFPVPGLE